MSERSDTISQDLSPQHDPSLCPSWCHREHLLDADEGDGFHHDGEPVVVVPAFRQCLDEPDQIFVKPSRFVPLDGSFRPVLVELQSSSHMVGGLSPAEARELAQNLNAAADLATVASETAEPPACPLWCSPERCEARSGGPHFGSASELVTTTYDDVSLRVRKGQYDPEDSPVDGTSPAILLELDCTAFVDAAQRAVLSPQEARALAHMLLAVTDPLSAASRG